MIGRHSRPPPAGSGLDLRASFQTFARDALADHVRPMRHLNDIARPRCRRADAHRCRLRGRTSAQRISILEWPGADLAWRAPSSFGPAVPTLRHRHPEAVRRDVLDAIGGCRDRRGTYRFRNDHQSLMARRPMEDSP